MCLMRHIWCVSRVRVDLESLEMPLVVTTFLFLCFPAYNWKKHKIMTVARLIHGWHWCLIKLKPNWSSQLWLHLYFWHECKTKGLGKRKKKYSGFNRWEEVCSFCEHSVKSFCFIGAHSYIMNVLVNLLLTCSMSQLLARIEVWKVNAEEK